MTIRKEQEYAALSAFIYNNERGNRSEVNTLPLPPGWVQLREANGFTDQSNYDANFFSFTAGAFLNQSTGEIVIAYKGTDFLLELTGRAWETAGDITTDVAAGVGGTLAIPQFMQAALYYQDVKRWAQANGYDTGRISFTGHSLGGGIASVMAVWFNRLATTFAEAPFEIMAFDLATLAAVAAGLGLNGDGNPDFSAFYESFDLSGSAVFDVRQSLVTNYYVQGEFLELLRTAPTTIYGTSSYIEIGEQPISRALDLHSMNLHLALLLDDRLRQASAAIPELIPELINKNRYFADPNSATRDFITALVADQLQGDLARQDGLLGHFSAEVLKLKETQVTVASSPFRKALVIAAMEQILFNPEATTTTLFTSADGGIHLNLDDVSNNASKLKGAQALANAAWSVGEKEGNVAESAARAAKEWHIQRGTQALTWTASSSANQAAVGGTGGDSATGGDGDDLLMGLEGADSLKGLGGTDRLIGGDGADELDGGEGSDHLYGGAGSDSYRFSGDFGNDWIVDSDGQGNIVVNGTTLSGAQKLGSATGVYKDKATGWTYAKAGNDLVIYKESESQNRIVIRGWSEQKSLGITLSESTQNNPSSYTFIGDYKKNVSEFDEFGNYKNNGSEPGAPDILEGSPENDAIIGLDGDDALFGKKGDDYIDGGSGVDVLMGGLGADSIFGGSGTDIIYGSSTGGFRVSGFPNSPGLIGQGYRWQMYAEERDSDGIHPLFLTDALDRDEQWNDKGNYIEAGSGEDIVYAGTGSDIVYGGDNIDDIYGMAGSDVLYGEAGGDRIYGDGPDHLAKEQHIYYTPPDKHANDIISGGAGNDSLFGQGADDEIYGNEGDDLVYGDDRNLSDTPIEVHGNDYLDGGVGKDTLCGGGGNDSLYGGQDDDQMHGDDSGTPGPYQGKDYLDGEDGDDYLVGNGNSDSLFGGQGHDSLFGDDQDDPEFHGADYLDGEDGNDELTGGGGSDEVFGGAGDDSLFGDDSYVDQQFHGNDYLDGEAGNDTLVGQGGDDVLEGGADDDTLLGDGDADDGQIGNDRLSGGSGDDYLFGGAGNDTLYGGEGDDTLDGGEGVNILNGGGGTDVYKVSFENGALTTVTDTDGTNYVTFDDAVAGAVLLDLSASTESAIVMTHGDGAVKIATGAWNGEAAGQLVQIVTAGASHYVQASQVRDHVGWVMRGTTTADVIDGSLQGDRLSGGDGDDALQGSQGDDQLVGGDGADLLDGGDDKDTIVGGSGNDHLLGGKGQDGLTGDAGNDTLEGGQDDDVLIGGDGDDAYVIQAGDGNDKLLDTGGNDQLVFGTGLVFDDVTFEQKAGTANVTMRFASGQDVTLFNGLEGSFETIKFGDGSTYTYQDLINQAIASGRLSQVATYGDDFMQGSTGPDVLSALAGNDTLAGGAGTDRLLGGTGQDTYLFNPGGGLDTIEDGEGGDIIRFGAGITMDDIDCHEETVGNTKYLVISYGVSDAVRVRGGIAGSGISTVVFSDQTAIAYGDFLGRTIATGSQTGTAGADALYAGAADDALLGLGSNDSLFGGHGNDTLRGGAGADELHGGAGDDELNGGANNDSLEGGAGADRYELTLEVGHDVIVDTQGPSVLVAAAGIVTANLRFRREGADLTLYLDGTTDCRATVKGFYDQPDLWSWQQGSGGNVSLKSLVQANATVMASQTEASLVAAEMGYFKASLTQNWLDKTFDGSPYARGSDGVYRWSGADGAGGNMRTQAYTVSSATMFSDEAIADFDTTTDDAFSSTTESIGTRTWTEKVIRHVPQGPLLEWPPGSA